MVRFFSAMGREVRGMHEAAYVLAGFALLSQVLALLRDRTLGGELRRVPYARPLLCGVPHTGFSFCHRCIAALALCASARPLAAADEGRRPHGVILQRHAAVFLSVWRVIAGVLFFLVPALVERIAPGFVSDPVSHAQLILLVRILLLQPIFLGASNTLAALTQLRHRFVLYSISPLLYNLGIIFGVVFLYPHFGHRGPWLGRRTRSVHAYGRSDAVLFLREEHRAVAVWRNDESIWRGADA